MTERLVDIIAAPEIMSNIIKLDETEKMEKSKPMALDSVSEALDSPFGVDEVKQVMEVVTLVSQSGLEIIGLIAAIKALLGGDNNSDQKTKKVEVRETHTQKLIIIIDENTDIEKLEL